MATMTRTLIVSEDLGRNSDDSLKFCATVEGDCEQGGFGRTEREALTMLARMSGSCYSAFTRRAAIERIATH